MTETAAPGPLHHYGAMTRSAYLCESGQRLCREHAAERAAKFDQLLQLERNAKSRKVTAALGDTPAARNDAQRRDATDRQRLFAALDALTPAEQAAYGAYRQHYLGR